MNTLLQMVSDLLQLLAATPTPRLVIDPLLLFLQGRRTTHENKHTDGCVVMCSQTHHFLTDVLTFYFPIFSQNVEMTQIWPRKSEPWEEGERANVPAVRSCAFFHV